MVSLIQKSLTSIRDQKRIIGVLTGCALLSVIITYVLYNYTQVLLTERLQDRLIAVVATAAQEIDAADIREIRSVEDLEKPEMKKIVDKLTRMRNANPDITYAYILRRTDDPNIFTFVADADSLLEASAEDINKDGIPDNLEDIPMPGDELDVSTYPSLKDEAHFYPVAADELEEDQWSVQLSAYAPIMNEEGYAVAVIGIDVTINDFKERTQAMLLPFLLFIFALLLLLTLLTLMLVRFYNERVKILREIDRQKDELLSIVSHQLATPVASIKWYLEMMLDGDVGPISKEQTNHVQTLQKAAANLADLVSMILDVSRIQLGKMKVDKAPLNLNEFFSEILSVFEPKISEKNINLVTNIDANLPTAMLDKRLCRMTLENLLSNAIKYTPDKGKVTFNVELQGDTLYYEVSDTGCGIPKKDHEKIFGKLFRASNVSNVDGNGFGLFAAKGAVENQGGRISFESEEGQGTTFRVILPVGKTETSSTSSN